MHIADAPTATRWEPARVLRTLGVLHGELRVRHGLSLHAYLTLGTLAEAATGSMPVARLTASLRESGDRMSYVLRGLQAAGLVERDRAERDRRTVDVSLTDAGRAAWADAEKTAQALLRRHLAYGVRTASAGAEGGGNTGPEELPATGDAARRG
ncbi:MarR family transcriptional regulator [Streptomyces sp. NPDC054842]